MVSSIRDFKKYLIYLFFFCWDFFFFIIRYLLYKSFNILNQGSPSLHFYFILFFNQMLLFWFAKGIDTTKAGTSFCHHSHSILCMSLHAQWRQNLLLISQVSIGTSRQHPFVPFSSLLVQPMQYILYSAVWFIPETCIKFLLTVSLECYPPPHYNSMTFATELLLNFWMYVVQCLYINYLPVIWLHWSW